MATTTTTKKKKGKKEKRKEGKTSFGSIRLDMTKGRTF